jgi:hypothetical protein
MFWTPSAPPVAVHGLTSGAETAPLNGSERSAQTNSRFLKMAAEAAI